jgi:hypothetical protein
MLPEAADNKGSVRGILYIPGGFCIWGGDPTVEDRTKRKLSAILSADVKGYSRLMGQDIDHREISGQIWFRGVSKKTLSHIS